MKPPEIGDYVIATKYRDGDPKDHWAVGFLKGFMDYPGGKVRYDVGDEQGKSFRGNGFRRVKKISFERGKWLLDHEKLIGMSSCSVWFYVRVNMKFFDGIKGTI